MNAIMPAIAIATIATGMMAHITHHDGMRSLAAYADTHMPTTAVTANQNRTTALGQHIVACSRLATWVRNLGPDI